MEFVRVDITAISFEECNVTFQVCVSVMTRPVSSHMWQCSLHPVHTLYTVHCMFVECPCVYINYVYNMYCIRIFVYIYTTSCILN